MMTRTLIWLEFVGIVIPATVVIVGSTSLLPFGVVLRPEFVIPAYIGGIAGIYSLWKMFFIITFGKGVMNKWIALLYALGVYSVISIPIIGGHCTIQNSCWKFFISPWMLPIIVGVHWLYLVSQPNKAPQPTPKSGAAEL